MRGLRYVSSSTIDFTEDKVYELLDLNSISQPIDSDVKYAVNDNEDMLHLITEPFKVKNFELVGHDD